MSIYTTPEFWRGASERAIKTFCQSLLAVLTTGAVGILDVDWPGALSAAALATLVSLLTSVSQAEFTAGADKETLAPSEPVPQAQTREERQQQEAPSPGPLF